MEMIQLYGRDERDFQGHNGRVLTDISNDTITWQLNTQYEFQFDYPLFAKHGLAIQTEMIVTVPVPGYDPQAFRINSVEKSMGVLTVHAYHVFWDLMQNFVEDINVVGKEGDAALSQIMTQTQFPNEFTYRSTVGNTASARIVRMSVIAALIGTDDNTVLSRWGGEFEWDNFHFNHVAKLGQDRGVVFRNGKNLLGYKATEDLTNTVTRIMPEGYNGLFLPELYVDSPLIDDYATPRIAKIEYSDIKAIDEDSVSADGETDADALPLDQALDALRAAASREYERNEIDKPGLEFELNVVMLEDTEEYRGRGIFSRVYPGDTARFIHDEDGLDVKARMTGYTWRPSTEEYLTQSYYSSAALRGGTDVEHKIDNLGNQITVIDKTTKATASNNSNTIGWSTDTPPESSKGMKEGDLWYQQVGNHVIMWMWHDGAWTEVVSDISGHDASNIIDGTFNGANVNVINLNGNSIVANSITGDKLAANSILVGLNKDLDTIQMDPDQIMMYEDGNLAMLLNSNGMYVSKDGEQVGFIHANSWDEHPDVRGLTFDILPSAKYIAWGHQMQAGGTFYTALQWMDGMAAEEVGERRGFTMSDSLYLKGGFRLLGAGTFEAMVSFEDQVRIYQELHFANASMGNVTIAGAAGPIRMTNSGVTNEEQNMPAMWRYGGTGGIAFGQNDMWLFYNNKVFAASKMGGVATHLYGRSIALPTEINGDGSVARWVNMTLD